MAGPAFDRSFSSSSSLFSCAHCLPPPVSLGPLSLDVWLADLRSRSDFLLLLHFGRAYIFFFVGFSLPSTHIHQAILALSLAIPVTPSRPSSSSIPPPPLLDCARARTARLLTATWPLTWHIAQPPANLLVRLSPLRSSPFILLLLIHLFRIIIIKPENRKKMKMVRHVSSCGLAVGQSRLSSYLRWIFQLRGQQQSRYYFYGGDGGGIGSIQK